MKHFIVILLVIGTFMFLVGCQADSALPTAYAVFQIVSTLGSRIARPLSRLSAS